MNLAKMHRTKLMIAVIVPAALFLCGCASIIRPPDRPTDQAAGTESGVPVSELSYCSQEEVRPCVVSFGLDANDNMLVNLLLPEPSFPNFQLTVMYGEKQNSYICRKVAVAKSNAYCIGEKYPPGEVLHFMLISIQGEMLLAEGDLSIIGLAFPTLEIITQTGVPTEAPEGTGIPEPTFIPPTPTKSALPRQTPITFPTITPPSYP